MSFTEWLSNRWSHISYGINKDAVDLVAFLAPIQKQLAPLEQAEFNAVVNTVTPIVIAGIQNQTKGLDIAHQAGTAVEAQLPEIAIKIGTGALSALVGTIQAAQAQAAQTAPPPV